MIPIVGQTLDGPSGVDTIRLDRPLGGGARITSYNVCYTKLLRFQLNRGQRLVEILKQPQFQPVAVAKQVLIIYAATTGRLDDIAASDVARYERDMYAYFERDAKDT